MSEQQPTRSDPTPGERTGDSSIKPVVIAFAVTILILLVVAIIFIKARQSKVVPKANDSRPTSQIMRSPVQTPIQPETALAA
jgi:hypothetical protein